MGHRGQGTFPVTSLWQPQWELGSVLNIPCPFIWAVFLPVVATTTASLNPSLQFKLLLLSLFR